MSWTAYQTAPRIPTLLGDIKLYTATIYPIWRSEDGYFLFYTQQEGWIISSMFGMSFKIDDSIFYPTYNVYNKFPVYQRNNIIGSEGIYYDGTYGWVYNIDTAIGYPCVEYWRSNNIYEDPFGTGEYKGPRFYTGTIPTTYTSSNIWQARGFGRGNVYGEYTGTPITIDTYFEYWKAVDVYLGEYKPQGDATGDSKWFGNPQWKDQNNKVYIRSTNKISNKYTYGDIYYDATNSKWIIGTYNNPTGWWEGYEPIKNSSVIFLFKVPLNSELTGEDLTISFDQYVLGSDTQTIYLGEVSRWF